MHILYLGSYISSASPVNYLIKCYVANKKFLAEQNQFVYFLYITFTEAVFLKSDVEAIQIFLCYS